jgi:uncharacterized protein (UPF0276 family)
VRDSVGIGWRPELAAGILSHLDRIDVVEVIADDLFAASKPQLRAIQTLAVQVPVVLHGVSLGLASSAPVDGARLDDMARVVDAIQPDFWSEHLAFVRSDGLEIGHLAAPPRTDATIAGTVRNLERAGTVVGTVPLVENVATLVDPPGSVHDEATWIAQVVHAAGCELLLDLNNLYANAVNFGVPPSELLARMPLDRVSAVHLAGGRWISASTGERRLLDDHLHDVPDAVFDLLAEVGARVARPVTVILERDGAYPPFEVLLAQLERARDALALGRLSAVDQVVRKSPVSVTGAPYRARPFEAYLARLYVDAQARARFLADPGGEAERAGLDPAACAALTQLDRVGLELAAQSFQRKRRHAKPPRGSSPGRRSGLLRRGRRP